jgi:uncharacterized membrane protein YadS
VNAQASNKWQLRGDSDQCAMLRRNGAGNGIRGDSAILAALFVWNAISCVLAVAVANIMMTVMMDGYNCYL